jgi:FtsZ-binding cell division protein ZapB
MYLASKSNYQHILDGTHLPGVTYPETLAENLTSKRTNHKLAEQGRRNRINNALKEIETLVPQDFANARNAKEAAERRADGIDKEKEKAASQAISKASAVEMAIDYIRSLQHELGETKGKLAVAETQLGHKIGQ